MRARRSCRQLQQQQLTNDSSQKRIFCNEDFQFLISNTILISYLPLAAAVFVRLKGLRHNSHNWFENGTWSVIPLQPILDHSTEGAVVVVVVDAVAAAALVLLVLHCSP